MQKINDEVKNEFQIPISSEIEIDNKISKKVKEILNIFSHNSTVGIIALSREIEIEIRSLAMSVGTMTIKNIDKISLYKLFETLVDKGYLPRNLLELIRSFLIIRNRIVHGIFSYDEKEITRILDVGLELLHVISAINLKDVYKNHHDSKEFLKQLT